MQKGWAEEERIAREARRAEFDEVKDVRCRDGFEFEQCIL